MKLKHSDKQSYRQRLLEKQGNKCPLCKKIIKKGSAALDHDHKTGYCRAALHKNCNGLEGRVKHWASRSGISPDEFLKSILRYWKQDYSGNAIHPDHKTEVEKEIAKLKKKIRGLKRESSKQKYLDKIAELEKEEC